LLTAFFIIILKPTKAILRFIFYKILVRGYSFYFSLIKKLGWEKFKGNFLSFLFSEKITHIFAGFLIFITIFFNLSNKTKAGVISDNAHETIMAGLVQSEFGDLGEDELIEETADEGNQFSSLSQSYSDDLTAIKSQQQTIIKSPDELGEEDNLATINQEGSAIIKPEIATTKTTKQPRAEIIYYTIKPGDTISTIADEFSISVNTILWENNLSAYSLIRPGNQLTILPITGVTHSVAKGENIGQIAQKYGIEENKILEANNLTGADKLAVGKKLVIPGGRKISYTTTVATSYTGLSAIKDLIIPPAAQPAINKMNWPTEGHRITQYYSWRHLAIDIANKIGTPLYAADTGVVEYAGWSTGYGNNIVINHGGGKKTRYAHLSQSYVKKGQEVDKGDTIGAMGSTGWSTGSHLHFEVIIDGRKYNPLNYIQ
jgi:murein DD-endopeptidase MepM/ murein hydrolase activator NlpD